MGAGSEQARRGGGIWDAATHQVIRKLIALADEDVVVLHHMPIHRGQEIAADVGDDTRSLIWRQAANRLPTTLAVLELRADHPLVQRESTSGAIGQTVFIGVTSVIFTVIAILLLDRLGRRVFLLIDTIGLTVALVVLGAFFCSATLQADAPWLSLVALVGYIACFAMGLGPVFWLMISEIFPLELRGPAMALCTVANWSFNFIVSYTFLTLVGDLGKAGTFWLYAVVGVIAVIFFDRLVHETKGRSLKEIQDDVGTKTRKRRRIGRHSTA